MDEDDLLDGRQDTSVVGRRARQLLYFAWLLAGGMGKVPVSNGCPHFVIQ